MMDPARFLPQVEKLLEDARHLRDKLEVEDGSDRAMEEAMVVVATIVELRKAINAA